MTAPTWTHISNPDALFAAYRTLHAQLVQQKNKGKFLLFIAQYAGMANRMQGIVSAYALALLTNRALVVVWTDFTVHLSDLLETPSFAWDFKVLPSALHSWLEQEPRHVIQVLPDWSFPGVPAYEPGANINGTMDSLLCSDLYHAWSSRHVVALLTWSNLLPFLYSNPHYKDFFERMFGSAENVFGALAREVLRPSAAVRHHVRSLPQHTVAMHIRTLFEYSPRFQMSRRFEATFFACARRIAARHGTSSTAPVFLSTDRLMTRWRARQRLQARLLNPELGPGERMGEMQHMHGGQQGATPEKAPVVEKKRAIKAASDLWQVALARQHVISPWSTFSSVALALSNTSASDVKFAVATIGVCTPVTSVEIGSHAWQLVLAELDARQIKTEGTQVGKSSFARCISRSTLPAAALRQTHKCYLRGCWPPWAVEDPRSPHWANPRTGI
mmetsp:Transcript_9726/g.16133  ORF Transcript_9726/g.16133 Transcript_9726/m.16133 type:complete len:444 (+) Transcript_9726:257-1588(+)